METLIYILLGIVIGIVVGYLIAKAKSSSSLQTEKEESLKKYTELDREFVSYKATASNQLKVAADFAEKNENEIIALKDLIEESANQLNDLKNQFATASANLVAANKTIIEKNKEIESIKEELKNTKTVLNETNQQLATAKANNEALDEKLKTHQKEMEELGKKFNTEFENIANKILETKTQKFTELNKTNLSTILEPLGISINDFKKQVADVYNAESKERFSLGEKVKELAQLNQVISEEAKNLTKALKGEAKTQGRWGEMILESILERSGLRKNEQYFLEHELRDKDGTHLRSDSEGKKMRPDAVIKYPDNRNVIIDSKVSLNAFSRLLASTDVEEQKQELEAHIAAIKTHIITLSAKGYDDYDKALDFVMMFIPSEPAYIAALQGDADLWNFAYDKRILLISPTNLIISLKLIVDLWKREYQNQNALEIAERGAKLFDKFVGFIANLEVVGKSIDRAKDNYTEAYKQLSTGNDNLVSQATKLKNLGLKTKKELPQEIINISEINELPQQ